MMSLCFLVKEKNAVFAKLSKKACFMTTEFMFSARTAKSYLKLLLLEKPKITIFDQLDKKGF